MKKIVVLFVAMLLPVLGWADAGLAQSGVTIQGAIQSVDCQRQTVVLQGPNGSNTLAAASSTAVIVNSTSVPFCTLRQYVGASATAWLIPSGNELQVSRIDVVGQGSGAPAPAAKSPSIVPIVLGALAVGAIGYVIGRSTANHPAYPQGYYYGPGYQYGPGYPYGPAYQYGPAYPYSHPWGPGGWDPQFVRYCESHGFPAAAGCPVQHEMEHSVESGR